MLLKIVFLKELRVLPVPQQLARMLMLFFLEKMCSYMVFT